MSKDIEKFDDFDFDDFDSGAGFQDPFKPKSNREAIQDIPRNFLQGFKETATSPALVRDVMVKALPKGYGDALDVADGIVSDGVQAYREVERELGPAIKGFKRAAKRAKPLLDPLIPKSISEKLDKLLQTEDDARKGQIDQTEAAITSGLAEIFGAQQEADAARDKETEARETTREVLADKRAAGQQETLNTIATGISHLVGYQNNIGVKFQRKSLELQYRQYYIARDQLELLKVQAAEHTSLLRSITQNTALPEIQKIKHSEQLKQAMQEKLWGAAAQKFSDYTRTFRQDVTKRIFGQLKQKGLEFAEGLRQGSLGLEMAADGVSMSKDMGINETDIVAQGLGGGAAKWLGGKLAKPIRSTIKAFGLEDKVARGDRRLRYGMENDAAVAQEWARSQTEESNIPGWTALQNFFKESIRQFDPTQRLAKHDANSLSQSALWTNLESKSLVEVIPGLLSRLLQSSESIRTYGIGPFTGPAPQVDAIRFDHRKGDFATERTIQKRIRKAGVQESDFETFDRRTEDILNSLTKDTDVSFDQDERRLLKVELLKRAETEQKFTPSSYLNDHTYGEDLPAATRAKFQALLKKGFSLDEKGKVGKDAISEEREIGVNRLFKDLKYAYPSMGEATNFYANTGLRDLVLKSGLTTRRGDDDIITSDVIRKRFGAHLQGVPYDEEMGPVTEVQDNRPVVSDRSELGGRFYADRSDRFPDVPATSFSMGMRTEAGANFSHPTFQVSETLEDTIRETSAKPEAVRQVELLEELLELIATLPLGGGTGGGFVGPNRPGRLKRWGKAAGSKIWGGIKGVYNAGVWARNKLVGGAFNVAKWGLGKLTGKDQVDDVYVPGKAEPVLTKWRLLAGEYFDALTKLPIKSFKDIKGAVLDKDGNEVLSVQGAKEAFLKNGKSLMSFVSGTFSKFVKDPVMGLFNFGLKTTGNVAKKLWRWNLANQDICVKGEEPTVRLYAHVMRDGRYHDAKDPSKTIYSFKDIHGAVLDDDGNEILPLKDFQKGLVTKDGTELKTTFGKLWGGAKAIADAGVKAAKWGWGKTKKAYGWLGEKAKGGWDWAKGKLKGAKLPEGVLNNSFNGQFAVGLGTSNDLANRQLDILIRIHNLLIRGFKFDDTPLNPEDFTVAGVTAKLGAGLATALTTGKEAFAKAKETAADALDKAKAKVKGMDAQEILSGVGDKLESLGIPKSMVDRVRNLKIPSLPKLNLRKRKLEPSEYDDPSTFGDRKTGKNRSKLSQWQQHFMRKAEVLKNDQDGLTVDDLKSLAVGKAKSLKDRVKERFASEGERENSFLDIIKDRAALKAQKLKDRSTKGSEGKESGGGGGWIGKLMLLVGGISGGISSLVSGITGLVGTVTKIKTAVLAMQAAKAVGDLAGGGIDVDGPDGKDGKKKPSKKPAGKMGKVWNAVKGSGRFLGNAAMQTVRWGLLKPTGWALRGAVALATMGLSGALAFLTSPVVLGAAAVAVTGYGLYKGYRWLKGELKPLERLRCAEYGGDPDDLSDWDDIRELEEKLRPHLKLAPGKPADLDEDLPWKELIELFDIDPTEDKNEVKNWADWFQYRFKPVYLTHITVLNQIQPGVLLSEIDAKLLDSFKVEFSQKVVFKPEGTTYPYTIAADPWGDTDSVMGRAQIDEELAAIEKEFGVEALKEKQRKKVEGTRVEAGSLGFVAGMRDGMPAIGAQGTGLAPSGPIPVATKRPQDPSAKALSTRYVAQSQANGAPLLKTSDSLNASFSGGRNRTLDDFAVVRLKTYGLKDLDVTQVNAILALETEILSKVSVTPQGKASITEDPYHYLILFSSHFGIQPADEEARTQWKFWFSYRFVPTLLNYVGAVRRIDKNIALDQAWQRLSKKALYDVAVAIATSKTNIEGITAPVWDVNATPFTGMDINMDSKSVDAHLNALKTAVGKDVYQTPTGTTQSVGKDGKPVKSTAYSSTGGVPDAFKPGNLSKLGSSSLGVPAIQTNQGTSPLLNGNPLNAFGAGSGQGYAQLPDPKGDGTLDAYRDLLTAAAQAAGIDPSLLFTMARIESSFRSKARNSASSAAGLFQFLNSTWREQLDKHGDKYGIPKSVDQTDPKAAALLAAEYIKANRSQLESKIGRQANATDLYAAHFLGGGGATKLLKASPTADATQLFPGPANSNPQIFYTDGRPNSVAEVIAVLDKKVGTPYNPMNPVDVDEFGLPKLGDSGQAIAALAPVAIGEVGETTRGTKPTRQSGALFDSAAKGVVGMRQASLVEVSPSAARGGFNSVTAPVGTQAARQLSSVNALRNADEQRKATAVEQSKAATVATQKHVKTAADLLQQQVDLQTSMDKTLTTIDQRLIKMLQYLESTPEPQQLTKPQSSYAATTPRTSAQTPAPLVNTKRSV